MNLVQSEHGVNVTSYIKVEKKTSIIKMTYIDAVSALVIALLFLEQHTAATANDVLSKPSNFVEFSMV